MLKIPRNGTIIAPASLHLPLYKIITEQYGNIQGIEVITLQTLVNRLVPGDFDEHLELLYKYKEALENLSKDNIFYPSRQDPIFLDACLSFLRQYVSYNLPLENLPETSQKEKDIKEALMLLKDIELRESRFPTVLNNTSENFSQVYILKKEYSVKEMLWVDYLLKQGASYLENTTIQDRQYWSSPNPRKLAVAISQYIIENNLDADSIFVSTSSQTDKEILSQIFDQFQIPYTILSSQLPSLITGMWSTALTFIKDRNIDNYKNLIDTFYPSKAAAIIEFLEEQPDFYPNMECRLQNIEYEDNALIDQITFERLQKAEIMAYDWMKEHEFLMDMNLEEAAKLIQGIHPNPSREDLSAFQKCMDLIVQAKSYLHEPEDLGLLIHSIETMPEAKSANIYSGVLIGTRNEISALRPINFLYNIHSGTYPAYQISGGIFDEAYMDKTDLSSLKMRLDTQKEQMENGLNQASVLIVTYPEADSKGKIFAPSDEIQSYLGLDPISKNYPDNDVFEVPEFNLAKESAKPLFFKTEPISMSVSRLETFTGCPLKHFLQYGLSLKEKQTWSDIRSQGTMLHKIVEILTLQYGKDYASVSREQLHELIEKEYAFGKKVYPHRTAWINSQIEEITYKLTLVLEQLNDFESNWKMNIQEREYFYTYQVEDMDRDINLYGYIDRVDTSPTSFAVFDYKSGSRELKQDHFEAGLSLQLCVYTLAYAQKSGLIPVGNFYISLNKITESQTAVKLAYNKKEGWTEIDARDILESYPKDRKFNGWIYQKDSAYATKEKEGDSSKTVELDHLTGLKAPSFEEVKQSVTLIVEDILRDISSGNIAPNYVDKACDWCSYRSICRNSRTEMPITSRIEKEVE
ncbi:MAG: PD-(D/E)XK nuclease family protein [Faecalicoccus sp.]|nr:PD-(D/E)XK nuclease family protein [Faecalicoccus sp.]